MGDLFADSKERQKLIGSGVYSAEGMAAVDNHAIAGMEVPSLDLMEQAGQALFKRLRFRLGTEDPVGILCGTGNNGGDGFVLARLLKEWGLNDLRVFLVGDPSRISPDCKHNLQAFMKMGGLVRQTPNAAMWHGLSDQVLSCRFLVEALVGTGFRPPLREFHDLIVGELNAKYEGTVIALDIPAGLCASEPGPMGPVLNTKLTLALGAAKVAHRLDPSRSHCGQVEVLDIGLPEKAYAMSGPEYRFGFVESPPERKRFDHKGRFGRVLVVGGVPGMEGAALLAAQGALAAGTGWVKLAVPEASVSRLAGSDPGVMITGLPGDFGKNLDIMRKPLESLVKEASVVVLGPGLGMNARPIVELAWGLWSKPLVVDADALKHLGAMAFGDLTSLQEARAAGTPAILTPHPAEMASLTMGERDLFWPTQAQALRDAARRLGHAIVVKTSTSVCAAADGGLWVNGSGHPVMAQGGSGDVLAGLLGALWAQDMARSEEVSQERAFEVLKTAVHWHGLAGESLAREGGQGAQALAAHVSKVRRLWRP